MELDSYTMYNNKTDSNYRVGHVAHSCGPSTGVAEARQGEGGRGKPVSK